MKVFIIGKNDSGQRFDKYLGKLLRKAPMSFLYKMLRKKNITLNGGKAAGSEKLSEGDEVRLFLSDETFAKFSGFGGESDDHLKAPSGTEDTHGKEPVLTDRQKAFAENIIYEDDDILFWNKPQGVLSQPDSSGKASVVEMLQDYLIFSGSLRKEDLALFHPAPVNRLDRNTSGIVLCGTSLRGLQFLSKAVHDRTICKKYICVVSGSLPDGRYDGWLKESASENKVHVSDDPLPNGRKITTGIRTIGRKGEYSVLEVELVTGRKHQIRAHLSHLGCGILCDTKYGDPDVNRAARQKYGIRYQLLHAAEVSFTEPDEPFAYLSGKCFKAELPAVFRHFI